MSPEAADSISGPKYASTNSLTGSHAAVEIDRGDQRLEHVGEHRLRHRRVDRHSFAQHQKLAQPQRLADLGTREPAHDDRLELGEVAFEEFGELVIELLADDFAEDRVAEEFEPLVRGQAMIGAGSVRERRFQERDVRGIDIRFVAGKLPSEIRRRALIPPDATPPWGVLDSTGSQALAQEARQFATGQVGRRR